MILTPPGMCFSLGFGQLDLADPRLLCTEPETEPLAGGPPVVPSTATVSGAAAANAGNHRLRQVFSDLRLLVLADTCAPHLRKAFCPDQETEQEIGATPEYSREDALLRFLKIAQRTFGDELPVRLPKLLTSLLSAVIDDRDIETLMRLEEVEISRVLSLHPAVQRTLRLILDSDHTSESLMLHLTLLFSLETIRSYRWLERLEEVWAFIYEHGELSNTDDFPIAFLGSWEELLSSVPLDLLLHAGRCARAIIQYRSRHETTAPEGIESRSWRVFQPWRSVRIDGEVVDDPPVTVDYPVNFITNVLLSDGEDLYRHFPPGRNPSEEEMSEYLIAKGMVRRLGFEEAPKIPPPPQRREPRDYLDRAKWEALPEDSTHWQHPRQHLLLMSKPYGGLYAAMLAAHDRGAAAYECFLQAMPINRQARGVLKALGVSSSVLQAGIPPQYAQITTEHSLLESSDDGFMSGTFIELNEAFALLTPQIQGSRRLFQKLVDSLGWPHLRWQPSLGSSNFAALLDLIREARDRIRLSRLVGETLDFMGRPMNLVPNANIVMARHHLERVRRILRGDHEHDIWQGLVEISHVKKDPVRDITIGNAGGTCIGVYLTGEGKNSYSEDIPLLFADLASQFVAIRFGSEIRGMALLFACVNERDEPVLAINSIELDPVLSQAPTSILLTVTRAALQYIVTLAAAAGFRHTVISTHGYNTGYNQGRQFATIRPSFRSLSKIHPATNDATLSLHSDLFAEGFTLTDTKRFDPVVLDQKARVSTDPVRFLMTTTYKILDDGCLARAVDAKTLHSLLRDYPLAYHTLEDKPVGPDMVRHLHHFLAKELDSTHARHEFCVRLMLQSWPEAKAFLGTLLFHMS